MAMSFFGPISTAIPIQSAPGKAGTSCPEGWRSLFADG
jgi:hypothetical protein